MRSMAAGQLTPKSTLRSHGLLPVGVGVGAAVSVMVVPKSNLRPHHQPLVFALRPSPSHIRLSFRCNAASLSSEAEEDVFSVITSSNRSQVDYLGQSTKGDLNLNSRLNSQATLEGPIQEVAKAEAQEAEHLLQQLGIGIAQRKAHISELNLHAEAQALEYKEKFKSLEAMAEKVKLDVHATQGSDSSSNKSEKNASKPRGSSSPFKFIIKQTSFKVLLF